MEQGDQPHRSCAFHCMDWGWRAGLLQRAYLDSQPMHCSDYDAPARGGSGGGAERSGAVVTGCRRETAGSRTMAKVA
ncbi:uncharacterized protein MYCFIDRAFT_209777 [Pseudocercospora fijiensis CIRAD86]|uniref:Uncharacterized protein n=1 Tax=Pseudocercospora fijiensis (strain CIRAD86) TaxID=383855 RepID=N1Q967_PSEFD|nr:uncharacterized protein MYCFIDRAFT_209777 [Pseudocercospora fijiensis CIRAD86]EME88331.1 hypothetical protein MYCFIDRAFT_209777 [Pseudocercospora fijiensis CIRAD86]